MSNSTSFLGCNHNFDEFIENLKYAAQLVYLLISLILLIRMLYVITVSYHDHYANQPFWDIYVIDCTVGLISVFSDAFYYRLTIFVPQVCESFSFFLRANPFLSHISLPLWYYTHAAKMLCQVFLSFERILALQMSFSSYRNFLKSMKPMRYVYTIVFLFPITLIWNVVISETFIQFYYGGFSPGYARRVNWFGTTAWQLRYMQASMALTIIANFATIYLLLVTTTKTERNLSLIWIVISIEYLLCATVFCYLQMRSFPVQYIDLVFVLVMFTWDGINILSPFTMMIFNWKLRKQMFTLGADDEYVFYNR